MERIERSCSLTTISFGFAALDRHFIFLAKDPVTHVLKSALVAVGGGLGLVAAILGLFDRGDHLFGPLKQLLFRQHRNHMPKELATASFQIFQVNNSFLVIHVSFVKHFHFSLEHIFRPFFEIRRHSESFNGTSFELEASEDAGSGELPPFFGVKTWSESSVTKFHIISAFNLIDGSELSEFSEFFLCISLFLVRLDCFYQFQHGF